MDEDAEEFVKPGEKKKVEWSAHCSLQLPENGKWRGAHLVSGHMGVPPSFTKN